MEPEVIFKTQDDLQRAATEAVAGALVTRGKNKGMLLAKCPPVGTDEAAAWQAIQSYANPFKTGMAHMMFMSNRGRIIYAALRKMIRDNNINVSRLDRDRKALEAFGVW